MFIQISWLSSNNDLQYTYRELHGRVNRLAGALKTAGLRKGDRVAMISPNVPPMLEAHFGPMRMGAVLVTINTRLSSGEVAYILNHSGAKVLVFDSELAPTVRPILNEIPDVATFVQIVDTVPKANDIPSIEYEEFLRTSPERDHYVAPDSETDTITINYTSGTTGLPKGVQYTGRGAYLNALGEALEMGVRPESIYLWTVPHVPLQRLGFYLGCHSNGRDSHMPAPSGPRGDIQVGPRAGSDPHGGSPHGANRHVFFTRCRGATLG